MILIYLADSDMTNVRILPTVTSVPTSRRGRPRKLVNEHVLREAFAANSTIRISTLARILKVSRNTLKRSMTVYGITRAYSNISQDELDEKVVAFFTDRPESGYLYLHEFLRSLGLGVRRKDVKAAMARVRPLASALRDHGPIARRAYEVRRPNAIWHVDGHHKLILYGFVIHGFVDGFCRTVSGQCISKACQIILSQ